MEPKTDDIATSKLLRDAKIMNADKDYSATIAMKNYLKSGKLTGLSLASVVGLVLYAFSEVKGWKKIAKVLRGNVWKIGVVGNIGVGKTTFCTSFQEIHMRLTNYIYVAGEPVQEELFLKYLSKQYEQPGRQKKNAAVYKLQMYILSTFVLRTLRAMNEARISVVGGSIDNTTILIERTFLEEKLFRNVLLGSGRLTKLEYNRLEVFASKCVGFLRSVNMLVPDLVVWLDIPTYVTLPRIQKRAVKRKSENNLQKEYLDRLEVEYQKLGNAYKDGNNRSENPSVIHLTLDDINQDLSGDSQISGALFGKIESIFF